MNKLQILDRALGLWETISIVVGGIIGTSIFLVPSAVARITGAPGLAMMTWLLCGLLALCGALCYAELAAALPGTGGTYIYLKRANGPVGEQNILNLMRTVDKDRILNDVEPFLVRQGFIKHGPRGRELTGEGREYLLAHRVEGNGRR